MRAKVSMPHLLPHLLLRDGKSPFTTQHFLKRISKRNYWVESDWNGCKDATYGRFVAHAICIGIIQG